MEGPRHDLSRSFAPSRKRATMEGQTLTVTLTADDKPNQPCRRKVDGTDIVFTAPPHAREGITYDLTIAGMRNGTAIAISKNNPFMSSSLGGFEAAVVGAAVEAADIKSTTILNPPPPLALPPPPAPAPAPALPPAASAFGSVAASRRWPWRRRRPPPCCRRCPQKSRPPAAAACSAPTTACRTRRQRPILRRSSSSSSRCCCRHRRRRRRRCRHERRRRPQRRLRSLFPPPPQQSARASRKGGRGVLSRRRRHRKHPPLINNKAARPLKEAARHLTLRAALLALPLRAARPTRSI